MPQYTYRATDRFGNTIDGCVFAADHGAAILKIQSLGYTPIGVQVEAAAAAAPVAVAAGSSRPMPVDLTQPITTMPAAAADLYGLADTSVPDQTMQLSEAEVGLPVYTPRQESVEDASSASDRTARMARLEPWERSVPSASEATVAMNPIPSQLPRHRTELVRGLEKIPFGANSKRSVSLSQAFKETIVYPLFSGVKLKDLAQWYRQFATLIGAGLNLNQSFTALADNTKNPRLKLITENAMRQVRAGGYFSDVMAAFPWIFPAMHLEMVRAAERGGLLEDTLRQLGDYVEHEMEVRRLIARETLYPKIVLVALVFIIGLHGVTSGMPAISALILGGSPWTYFMDTAGAALMLLIPIVLLVAFFRLIAFNNTRFRHTYDEVKINLPVLGKIIRGFAIAKFSRTYAALSRSGFSSGSALEVAGDASGNVVMARAGRFAAVKAEQGGLPSQYLYETRQFSQMSIDMLRTAEHSGSIDAMMDKVADYHEADAKAATHTVCIIFSVLVLLGVCVLVGMTVIGFWTGYASGLKNVGG